MISVPHQVLTQRSKVLINGNNQHFASKSEII